VTQGDTLRVVSNQNIQDGRIRGLSINADGNLSKSLSYFASFNLTSGRELDDNEASAPLAHIPPAYGRVGMKYELPKWSMRAIYRYNGAKDIEDFGGSADNPDLATQIGALKWSTFNIYGTYNITEHISISASLENIMDLHYRPFAGGISAPGRNLILSIRGKI